MFQAQRGAREAGRHLRLVTAESVYCTLAVVVLGTGLCSFDPQQMLCPEWLHRVETESLACPTQLIT